MDFAKIDLLIQFALLVAGQEEDFPDRQLGPIHLLKYVYLADLVFAAGNNGETFTGTPWVFHKFGPWSLEVHGRIEPALAAIGAIKTVFPSDFDDRKEWLRWQLCDEVLLEKVDKQLPVGIASSVRKYVHQFGKDTPSLLEYVYRTKPMIYATPREILDFTLTTTTLRDVEPTPVLRMKGLSVKKKKRFKEGIEALRKTHAERQATGRKKSQRFVNPMPAPRYDEVYFEGIDWLDSLAGPPLPEGKKEAVFHNSVWQSSTRRGEDVS